jgi:hypothetical protein
MKTRTVIGIGRERGVGRCMEKRRARGKELGGDGRKGSRKVKCEREGKAGGEVEGGEEAGGKMKEAAGGKVREEVRRKR